MDGKDIQNRFHKLRKVIRFAGTDEMPIHDDRRILKKRPGIHQIIDDITLWFGMAGLQVGYVQGLDHGVAVTDRDGVKGGPWTVELDEVDQAIDRMMSMLGRAEGS